MNDVLHHLFDRQFQCFAVEFINQSSKACERRPGSGTEQTILLGKNDRLPHGNALVTRNRAQVVNGLTANTARRCVNHTLQRRVITTTNNKTQIRQCVSNLQAFVKSLATVNPIGKTPTYKRLFNDSGLCI